MTICCARRLHKIRHFLVAPVLIYTALHSKKEQPFPGLPWKITSTFITGFLRGCLVTSVAILPLAQRSPLPAAAGPSPSVSPEQHASFPLTPPYSLFSHRTFPKILRPLCVQRSSIINWTQEIHPEKSFVSWLQQLGGWGIERFLCTSLLILFPFSPSTYRLAVILL